MSSPQSLLGCITLLLVSNGGGKTYTGAYRWDVPLNSACARSEMTLESQKVGFKVAYKTAKE
jgi:hypothetical protein